MACTRAGSHRDQRGWHWLSLPWDVDKGLTSCLLVKPVPYLCDNWQRIVVTSYQCHPTGMQFVWLSQGCSPLRAASVLFALSKGFGAQLVPPCHG